MPPRRAALPPGWRRGVRPACWPPGSRSRCLGLAVLPPSTSRACRASSRPPPPGRRAARLPRPLGRRDRRPRRCRHLHRAHLLRLARRTRPAVLRARRGPDWTVAAFVAGLLGRVWRLRAQSAVAGAVTLHREFVGSLASPRRTSRCRSWPSPPATSPASACELGGDFLDVVRVEDGIGLLTATSRATVPRLPPWARCSAPPGRARWPAVSLPSGALPR